MFKSHFIGLAALLSAAAADPVLAQGFDQGRLQLTHLWVRATPNAAPTAAGYLTVTNRGRTADRLLGGATPEAGAIEPHLMSMTGGIMRMRMASEGFEIGPGASLTLSPGGSHLMLIGPKHRFNPGDRLPATLRFAHAGSVKVEFVVATAAPKP